ncbi:uncharacterized protein J3R85_002788 [Psidium guajava]|nr:uncharacterized protein J3R85_002788 [Psidium guajava]
MKCVALYLNSDHAARRKANSLTPVCRLFCSFERPIYMLMVYPPFSDYIGRKSGCTQRHL